MYWKDYSFYCVPSVNRKADRSWMAYGQRGHTGCNHSPSSGEGNPKSATTPPPSHSDEGSVQERPHGRLFIHHPWFAPAGTSRRLPWETVAKDMPCCLHSQVKGEPEPFWQFPESSTERTLVSPTDNSFPKFQKTWWCPPWVLCRGCEGFLWWAASLYIPQLFCLICHV